MSLHTYSQGCERKRPCLVMEVVREEGDFVGQVLKSKRVISN